MKERQQTELLRELVSQIKAMRAELENLKTHVMGLKKAQSNKKTT